MIFEALFVISIGSNVVAVATSVEDACAERLGKGPVVVWQVVENTNCIPDNTYPGWPRCKYQPPYGVKEVRCVKRTEERWAVEPQ